MLDTQDLLQLGFTESYCDFIISKSAFCDLVHTFSYPVSVLVDQTKAGFCIFFRVIYLLRCCAQDEAVSYLLNRAFSEDTSISAAHRLRALRCLLAIADEHTIQMHYTKGISSIRQLSY